MKKRRKNSSARFIGKEKLAISMSLLMVGTFALIYWLRQGHTAVAAPTIVRTTGFTPTIPNRGNPPGGAPDGMVWIPGGEFSMGANDPPDKGDVGMQATLDARPIHRVYVDGFYMDKTDFTNAEFEEFVKATGYVTVAEQKPRADDFPGAPPENLVAGSVVFSPPDHAVPLDNHFRWWNYIPGANWRHPLGPESDVKGKENYPVVHIAYQDAEAYAKWAGKRLPTDRFFVPTSIALATSWIVGTRGKGEVSTGTNHLGFRCVKPARHDVRGAILRQAR